MAKGYSRPVAVFTYSRRIKNLKPGQVKFVRYRGRQVKVMLDPSGRRLKVLQAPMDLKSLIRKAEMVRVSDGTLQIIGALEKTKPKLQPKRDKPVTIEPKEEPKPVVKPEPETEQKQTLPESKPVPPQPTPKPPKPSTITEAERRKAMLVPVPDKGPIPTPYIDWSKIPQHCSVKDVTYIDYPTQQAPKGMLAELREMFRRSRRYQNTAPVNVLIIGPKGSGKSELVKKFAEDTGLPYWQVIGQEGIRADELLGHYELREGTSRWVDGIIPKAVRHGGILHIDEANVIEPAILMRLDELLDNKRQLNMEDLNGEIIKAHPDLFIVFTLNPPTYEGVKDLPEPIKSRLTKRYWMTYPPPEIEMRILKEKLKLSDSEFKPPSKTQPASGTIAPDIIDIMKIIGSLRKQTDLSYTPSMRETQAFIQDLREGDDFFTAYDRNIKALYWGEEADRIEEALKAVRGRPQR